MYLRLFHCVPWSKIIFVRSLFFIHSHKDQLRAVLARVVTYILSQDLGASGVSTFFLLNSMVLLIHCPQLHITLFLFLKVAKRKEISQFPRQFQKVVQCNLLYNKLYKFLGIYFAAHKFLFKDIEGNLKSWFFLSITIYQAKFPFLLVNLNQNSQSCFSFYVPKQQYFRTLFLNYNFYFRNFSIKIYSYGRTVRSKHYLLFLI